MLTIEAVETKSNREMIKFSCQNICLIDPCLVVRCCIDCNLEKWKEYLTPARTRTKDCGWSFSETLVKVAIEKSIFSSTALFGPQKYVIVDIFLKGPV